MLDKQYSEIYKAFYDASMKAIAETGDAYKQLSWFGKNKPQKTETERSGK